MRVLAIVGLTGSGKSEATKIAKQRGYPILRFGDVTDWTLEEQGLPLTEENERTVREALRRDLGMHAYAVKIYERIQKLDAPAVVLDGLYSWQEYTFLKEKFGSYLYLLAIYTQKSTRYERLASREIRPLSKEEAHSRDVAEIEKLAKGGPIAFADHLIVNNGSLEELRDKVLKVLDKVIPKGP